MEDWAGGKFFLIKLLFDGQAFEEFLLARKYRLSGENGKRFAERLGLARNHVLGGSSIILARHAVLVHGNPAAFCDIPKGLNASR
jgi:hypothetical protein